MRGVLERDSAGRARAAIAGVAVVLAVAAAACFTGTDKNGSTPTGVIGPTGGGGSSGGGNGALYNGTYLLQDVDDSTLPFQLAFDSVSGGDTTRSFRAWMDSSRLYLNSDSTAEETDYLSILDVRSAPDSSYNRPISFGDTLYGTFSPLEGSITVQLTDTVSGIVNVTYTVSGSTLTGTVPYVLYNTDNQLAATGQATYLFVYSGPPLHNVVGEGSRQAAVGAPHAAAARVGPAVTLIGVGAASHPRRWTVPAWVVAQLRSGAHAHTRP